MERDCELQRPCSPVDRKLHDVYENESSSENWSMSDDSTLKAPPTTVYEKQLTANGTADLNDVKLYIDTPKELQEFLREMLKDFVDNVVPMETSLVDLLMQHECLTSSGNDSLNGKHVNTPKEQALKLWCHLNKLNVEDFKNVVFPQLCRYYPHIVPRRFCERPIRSDSKPAEKQVTSCLRDAIMLKVRLINIAVVLYECRCITFQAFSSLNSVWTKPSDTEIWPELFQACSGHPADVTTLLAMKLGEVLSRYKIPLPQDLETQLRQGVPCTCRVQRHELPPGALRVQITIEPEEVALTVTSNDSGPIASGPNRFQTPGSQYLGSDDPDFNVMAPSADFKAWADQEGLSQATLQTLLREEMVSKDDLKLLKAETIGQSLRGYHNLPAKQRLLLEKLVKRLESEPKPEPEPSLSATAVPKLSDFLSDVSDSLRLLMFGKTGSGKSLTGNSLLGRDAFRSGLSMGSTTDRSQYEASEDETVQIMDCPGLFDTSLSLEDVSIDLAKAVVCMSPGPTALLYTLKIGDRYTEEEYRTFQQLKMIFGEEVCRYIIIVFTRGDELKKDGQTIKNYIQNAPERFQNVLRECGGRYVVFDNTPSGRNAQQLQELKEKVMEIKNRDGESHSGLQIFSKHGKKLEAEVKNRLKKFKLTGKFAVKKSWLRECGGRRDDKDGARKDGTDGNGSDKKETFDFVKFLKELAEDILKFLQGLFCSTSHYSTCG